MDVYAAGKGFARFSNDEVHRYRLARSLDGKPLKHAPGGRRAFLGKRVTFVMLNPSTADAFKLDPTVTRCMKWAVMMGAEVGEVVNLYAIRSTDPKGVWLAQDRGDDATNDQAILDAAVGAHRVVAAWGNHPKSVTRANQVARMLHRAGVQLHSLAMNNDGSPQHPLYISFKKVPALWP